MILPIINTVFFGLSVLFDVIFSFGFFVPKTVKEVSDERKTPITPTSWTFSIWIIIHTAEISFVVYYFLDPDNLILFKISGWYIAANVIRSIWLFLFTTERLTLSLLFILAFEFCLANIYFIADVKYFKGDGLVNSLIIYPTFSIYLAWVSCATILNFLITSKFKGTNPTDDELQNESQSLVSMAIIFMISLVTSILLYFRNDFVFAGTIYFAFIGILFENYTNRRVVTGAFFGSLVIMAFIFYSVITLSIS